MLDKLLFLVALAGTAVVFADVLVRPGMLLEPAQRWLRAKWYGRAYYQRSEAQCDKLKARMGPSIDRTQVEQLTMIRCQIAYERDLDTRWWWAPLWGCYKCVAGQWGFWGYLIRYHGSYSLPEHLAFTAFTIIAAIILHKWTQE